MSKEKTLRISEETEVMQSTGVPAQETEEVSTALATEIIADLKKANPFVEGNIFKSVENVNLSTIVAYKQNGVRHHFLDTYDDAVGNVGGSEE